MLTTTLASDIEIKPLAPLPDRALAAIRALKQITHTCPDAERLALDPDDTLRTAITTLRKIAHPGYYR